MKPSLDDRKFEGAESLSYKDLMKQRTFCDILNWNNCCLIWKKTYGFNRRLVFNSDIKIEQIQEIVRQFTLEKGEPIDLWVDMATALVFSSSENYFNWPHEFSFLNSKEGFLEDPLNGLHFVRGKYSYLFDRGFRSSSELITDLPSEEINKYEGKKILILGAGPSLAERIDSVNLDEYDFIWSCTKFFLNDEIKNIDLDLFSVGGNVELNDPDLEDFLNRNKNTKYGIECFVQPFKTKDEMIAFRDKHGAERGFSFHTRYFSKLGAGPRLLALAAILKASQVAFLGIDGYPIGHEHSFEKNKEYKTLKKDGRDEAPTRKGAEDSYRRQFCLLWAYLLSFTDTEFVNLGQGHPGNQSTDVFKTGFGFATTKFARTSRWGEE